MRQATLNFPPRDSELVLQQTEDASKQSFFKDLRQQLGDSDYNPILGIGNRRNGYLNRYREVLKHSVLKPAVLDRLATYAKAGDAEGIELTLIYSTRLVYSVATAHKTKFSPGSDELVIADDDLMQAGFVGIFESFPKWKKEKGHFGPFSYYYIMMSIRREVRLTNNLITIIDPARNVLAPQLPYLSILYESECGINPVTLEGFTEWLKLNGHAKKIRKGNPRVSDIEKLLKISNVSSLDLTLTTGIENTTVSILDTLMDENMLSPEEYAVRNQKKDYLRSFYTDLLKVLTSKQQKVFRIYYNLEAVTEDELALIDNIEDEIMLSDVAVILNHRIKSGTRWTTSKCQALHLRGMKRIRAYLGKNNISFDDVMNA